MKDSVWTLLVIIAAVTLVVLIIALRFTKLTRHIYYNNYVSDELIKVKKAVNSHNYLYFTHGDSLKYIRKYVICKTAFDKFLICNYNGNYKKISYYVVEYNALKKVIAVLKVSELGNKETSKVIALRRSTKFVNVIVSSVDDKEINSSVIKPKTNGMLRLRALFGAIECFLWVFLIRYGVGRLLLGNITRFYLNSEYNNMLLLIGLGIAVLYYIFAIISLKHKNQRILNGGVLEYEFL